MILFYALAWCYGFMASHGIYGHELISWIHSIHDLGSFSFGSGIFLFRIYVLLMSWHTSRILFYCYGFTPWVSFIPGISENIIYDHFAHVSELYFISWGVAIPGYAIHRIIGFRGPGLFPGLTFTQVIIDSLP